MINNSNLAAKAMPKADDEDRWIDIHDDSVMVYLGMRQPQYQGRDESVWTKTPEEKKQLAQLKARCTTILPRNWPSSDRRYPIYATLVVRINPSNKFQIYDKKSGHNQKKTTFSHKNVCVADIPYILAKYYVWKKESGRHSLVIWYSWNERKYNPNSLPDIRWK